jgi:hypothetical protein
MRPGIAQERPGMSLSVPDDWTHHHVVFSGARSEAAAEQLQYEPRYQRQWLLHNRPLRTGVREAETAEQYRTPVAADRFPVPGMTSMLAAAEAAAARAKKPKPVTAESGLSQDWASPLWSGATAGYGMYPAKFTFDAVAAPDCTNDYVAFMTGPTSAVAASRTGTFTGTPTNGQTVTIGGTLVLTASTTVNTGLFFQIGGPSNTTRATNLAAAIARNGASVGVTATSSAAVVTVTATTPGTAGNSITLLEGLNNFTWAGTTLTGGANPTTPSIVAYNNLYSTQSATLQGYCGGSGPSVRWAYTTGMGSVVTSPVLSFDGTRLIYVETKASGAVFHVLQWKSGGEGTVAAPATPSTIADWSACPSGASCVVNVAFRGAPQVTRSSPFYDYSNDVAYVGDDAGVLHKFTPVLSGTPAEVTTGGWPVTVDSGYVLNGPVVDPDTGRVFVTDSNGTNGKVCYVSGTSAVTCTASVAGIFSDTVVIDPSTGRVFAVSSVSGATVHQYTTSLASVATATIGAPGETTVGPAPVFSGAFDQAYYTSADGTGKMYVCGKEGSIARAALYRISLNAGTMSSLPDGYLVLTNNTGPGQTIDVAGCSPVMEFYNTSTGMDWIFLSVADDAATTTGTTCAASDEGCVLSLNVTGTAWPPAVMTAGYVAPDNNQYPSTSGIVVDNTAGTTTVPKTSLRAAVGSTTATSISVASASGFSAGDYVQVDAEAMQISAIAGTSLTVSRGALSTTAATHLVNTAVVDLRRTLLNGAITAATPTITVDRNTTFNVDDYIQVDSEAMLITAKPTATTLTVTRARLGSAAAAHADNAQVTDLSKYPQAASVYFSFALDSSAAALCNGSSGVGCAVKLTQDGLR